MKHYSGLMQTLQNSQLRPRTRTRMRAAAADPAAVPEAWLYAASAEAVLIVDLATQAIAEANPAAARLLGIARHELLGTALQGAFDRAGAEALRAGADSACARGCSFELIHCDSLDGAALEARMSLVRSGADSFLLVHVNARATARGRPAAPGSMVLDLLDEMPDGFVVTDLGLRVSYANRAFAVLSGGGEPGALHGENLARWLEFAQRDIAALTTQQALRQAEQRLTMRLRPSGLAPREVEVWAIAVPDGPQACWAFRIRARAE